MGMHSTPSRFGKRQLWDGRLNEALLCDRPGRGQVRVEARGIKPGAALA